MKKLTSPPPDDFLIRCPRLGNQIYFSYCLHENNGLPCVKSINCWSPYFDVEGFLKGHLTDEEWKKVFEDPGKPKILSLVEMIEQAKQNMSKKK